MSQRIKKVVIVGGGSAGWLTAGVIAAEHRSAAEGGVEVVLVESPNVKPIGVGEGTWPTMRATLKKIGLSESVFLRDCDASFKQGSQFFGWVDGNVQHSYCHPFTLPHQYSKHNLADDWQPLREQIPFVDAVSYQSRLCAEGLAPKQITTSEYNCLANYGYHLDAGKFASILQKHCLEKLGVIHIRDHMTTVNSAENGDIASIACKNEGDISGDLFIDCTGARSLLLGAHFGVPFVSKKDTLFVDSALAIQLPYASPDAPIASATQSTAQSAGWVWDIGLQSRRGVGHVYSSAHTSRAEAEDELQRYIDAKPGDLSRASELRHIDINPGHRAKFWERNCVAVGMSAGFLEPLEASALVLVELSAAMISEQLPANREMMDIVASRFNETFLFHWDKAVEFLKLHYVLSKREDADFWVDNRAADSIPESLQSLLSLWRYQTPWVRDLNRVDALFPTASFQYVLYGMGFETQASETRRPKDPRIAIELFQENQARTQKICSMLSSNRDLLAKIKQHGLQKV